MKKIYRLISMLAILTLLICSCQSNVTEQKKEATTQYMTVEDNLNETEIKIEEEFEVNVQNDLPKIDMTKWLYNSEDKIYYQIGLKYCENPVDESYQSFSIFVPHEYMNALQNEDDTYTCSINQEGLNNRYNPYSCPIVMPIETPGYSACKALTEYTEMAKTYTKEGFIYVFAGARGREHGAPLGVVDYKACIKYLKYNQNIIPGNTKKIITFGMSGGGAQSAILGVSGNSKLYEPYLEKIGAVKGYKDDIFASMCWCPITNLDSADMAYEWMMGETRVSNATSVENKEISQKLSDYYVNYINSLELKDKNGNVLTLNQSNSHSGSYYDYVLSVIENSLNNFFIDNKFPYTVLDKNKIQLEIEENKKVEDNKKPEQNIKEKPTPVRTENVVKETQPPLPTFTNPNGGTFRPFSIGGIIVGFTNTEESTNVEPFALRDETNEEVETEEEANDVVNTTANTNLNSNLNTETTIINTEIESTNQNESATESAAELTEKVTTETIEQIDNIVRNVVTEAITLSGTYETKEDYVKALNANGEWIKYDEETNKYKITSIKDFAMALKKANKNIASFDQLDRGQGENTLFGIDGSTSHFDKYLKEIIVDETQKEDFEMDFGIVDEFGNNVETRLNMISPAYYLDKNSQGYKTSDVAPYFRIRTGCWQSDTSLTTEINLDLLLNEYGVSSDFETVWGAGHEKAERVSTADRNFVSWVNYVSRKVDQ